MVLISRLAVQIENNVINKTEMSKCHITQFLINGDLFSFQDLKEGE